MPTTDLAALLDRASREDTDAFAAFFDLTICDAYRLARASVPSAGVDPLVRNAYLNAWLDSGSFPQAGLSARAWLSVLIRLNADGDGAPLEPVGPGRV